MTIKAISRWRRYIWVVSLMIVTLGYLILAKAPATPTSVARPQLAFGSGAGFWHTNGRQIEDSNGQPVRITGINWFGMDTNTFCPHGLWIRNWVDMLNQIRGLGYNALRLPFCSQMLDPGSTPNSINFNVNPDLQGLTGLQILDKIVNQCGAIGLRVILDRHALEAGNRTALWYDGTFTEQRWISDWTMLAERYRNNTAVVAADLHNEPHSPACWGCGAQPWIGGSRRSERAMPYWR